MSHSTGIIVILAYPDTIVRPATGEFSRKIWPVFGVGGKHAVQAGHAAMLLISKETKDIQYFDFGRYVTSDGFGRVRSVQTDPEVVIPFKAIIENNTIVNLQELLLFLEAHPENTHGEGRLVASVNTEIHFEKALRFIEQLQGKIEIPYGAFILNGSNCSRFVNEVLVASTTNFGIRNWLRRSRIVTPSPISNVIRGRSATAMFEVFQQRISSYENKSVQREVFESLWKKVPQNLNLTGTILPNIELYNPPKGQWLSGIGSGMWFELSTTDIPGNFTITRTCAKANIRWTGVFSVVQEGFNPKEVYVFLHGSTCARCFVLQNGIRYVFETAPKTVY